MKIKYTKELLDNMRLVSRITGALVKDIFDLDEVMYVVVEPGQIGKAVGKGGATIKLLQQKLQKRIKVVEFNPKMEDFVGNMIHPLTASVRQENNTVFLTNEDRAVRGQLIGRNAKNLNILELAVKRYFDIEDIKVE